MINLIIKDIKNIIYDKKSLALILLMPVILMSILGVSLKGVFGDSNNSLGMEPIKFAVVKEYDLDLETEKFENLLNTDFMRDLDNDIDLDEFNPERIFFEEFLNNKDIKKIANYQVVDRALGEKLLEEDEISALVILKQNFIYNTYVNMNIAGRNIVNIEVIKNIEKQFSADIIEMLMSGFTDTMNNIISRKMLVIDQVIRSGMNLSNLDVISTLISENSNKIVEVKIKEVTGEDPLNSFQYYSAAIMTMFLLYAASIGARALIGEKNRYTLQRLVVSGKSIMKFSLSNFVRIMIIAIFQSIIMIIYSKYALAVNWGDIITIIIAMFTSSFAVASLGSLISVITLITDRYYVANLFENLIVNIMALIGGSIVPIEILPKAMQKISFITINGSAINMYLNGMKYRPIAENKEYILVLMGMSIVFFFCAFLLIKFSKRRQIA